MHANQLKKKKIRKHILGVMKTKKHRKTCKKLRNTYNILFFILFIGHFYYQFMVFYNLSIEFFEIAI